ncbi:DNA ligase [Aeromonas phage PZL-Ah152]|uniref:DNA ligase n=1 Tax=Aeromonas phage PZL-Ah152 TaxID=2820393 RepID=A0A8A6C959_9CAUD|nr:DNA ligase [Aeromonas phage PZL-Ah152]
MSLYYNTNRVLKKRLALKEQATHTDVLGKLYKVVNGKLWVYKDVRLYPSSDILYPIYSKVNYPVTVVPLA